MSATQSIAMRPTTKPNDARAEPIWVFESNIGKEISRGAAAIARKCRGAESGELAGLTGSNYAIPTRDVEDNLLPWDTIKKHVQDFIATAKSEGEQRFALLPNALKKSDSEHQNFSDLFYNAPSNVELTGRMLESLGRMKSVRIIFLDANISVDQSERRRVLDQYFAANEGLWNAEYIEIISFGSALSIVANDKYASSRGYRHRIMNVDSTLYGQYSAQTRELLSVARATKLVCLNDPTGTTTGSLVGALQLATGAGLQIDELLIQ
jgi:hypothetical protein